MREQHESTQNAISSASSINSIFSSKPVQNRGSSLERSHAKVIHQSPAELRRANNERHPMELLRRLALDDLRHRQGVTDNDNESFPPPTRLRHHTPLHDSSTAI
ncbi:hypothetical protein V9T40_005434 [Parthenolecanium corni]|uniref:Uncharacterized protein n=1 Tax=Parthenolecanium corni TaxID=536013 RepID=A0AAN9TF40_9HEMI